MSTASNMREDVFINNRLVSFETTANYMYVKLIEVFTYEGLPLTIPKRVIEKYTTQHGHAIVYEYEGELFVSSATPYGGEDVNGDKTDVTILHRAGKINETLERTIGIDAVMVRNDSECIGLTPLINEFASLTAQAKITLLRNLVDLRSHYIIQAKDQNSYEQAIAYEEAVRAGDTAVILSEEFADMEGMAVHNTPLQGNPASQSIELFQYINSHYYSELGITVNNNMKKEYVSESEIEKSTGIPLINNMLQCRLEAMRDIKALFDVDITVVLSAEWNDEAENEESSNEPGIQEEGGGFGEAEAAGEGEPEGEAEAGEADTDGANAEEDPEAEGDSEEANPAGDEVEEVTEEERVEATEAMLGEGTNDDEADEDSAPGDPDSETDGDEDEAEGDDVEA